MDITPLEPPSETEAARFPLLMARPENNNDYEHPVDISRSNDGSSHLSHDNPPSGVDHPQCEERPSSSLQLVNYQTTLSSSNAVSSRSSPNTVSSRNSTLTRRNEGYTRRRRSPLNSGLWISVELVVTVGQIIASIVVLSLSRHENPQAPLFEWVVGYASGCIATLPILYWRYRNRNQGSEQVTTQLCPGSTQSDPSSEPGSYTVISVAQASDGENLQITNPASTNSPISLSLRLNHAVDHFKMGLDCFFAVWFVVGNVWIFRGHSSPSDAPNLYRLCIVFLTFSCIGYAMPFILCAAICCCLPCMISLLGIQDNMSQTREATPESISALPTYKFKLKKGGDNQDIDSGTSEGGILAAGTEKERTISGDDDVCCICLTKYADNEELRELPCSHFFHVACVDKWLKINASCPLCKLDIGVMIGGVSSAATNSSQQRRERRLSTGSTEGVYGSTMF